MLSTSCLVSPSCNLVVGGVRRDNNNNNKSSYIEYQQRRRSYNMAARRSISSLLVRARELLGSHNSHHHNHRLLTLRPHSSSSTGGGVEEDEEEVLVTMKKIEDAIHGIIVRRSAPDWLPFVPGSSYWVPSPPRGSSYGIADLLSNSLTNDELMSLTTPPRGWPSSAFFLPTPHTHYYFNGTSPAEDEEN